MSEPIVKLFAGDPYRCEEALAAREEALRQLDPDLERQLHFADEIQPGELELDLTSMSLFALGRHVVVRRIEKLRSPKAFVPLLDASFAEGTYLSLVGGDLRATHPIVKAVKRLDAYVALPPPRGSAARGTAKRILDAHGVMLTGPAFQQLLHRCGTDLMTIASEADKLRLLGGDRPLDPTAVEQAVFPSAERTVYPFYDRLGEGDLAAALAELRELREDSGRIVGGILRHLSRLMMIRLLLDRRVARSEIASAVGMPAWLLRRLVGQANRRSLDELARALRLGVRLDRDIKGGRLDAEDALMTLVFAAAGSWATRPPRPEPE